MMWKLQYRHKPKAQDEFVDEWEDVPGLCAHPMKQFKGVSEAFEYYFMKYGSKRSPYTFDYQFAPVFSTMPIPVEFEERVSTRYPPGTFRLRERGLACSWKEL